MTLTISILLILAKFGPKGLRDKVWDNPTAVCAWYFAFALFMILDRAFLFGEALGLPTYVLVCFAASIGIGLAVDLKRSPARQIMGLEEGAIFFGLVSSLEPKLILFGLAALLLYWEWDYSQRRGQSPNSLVWPSLVVVAALIPLGVELETHLNSPMLIVLLVAIIAHFAFMGSRIFMLVACAILVYGTGFYPEQKYLLGAISAALSLGLFLSSSQTARGWLNERLAGVWFYERLAFFLFSRNNPPPMEEKFRIKSGPSEIGPEKKKIELGLERLLLQYNLIFAFLVALTAAFVF